MSWDNDDYSDVPLSIVFIAFEYFMLLIFMLDGVVNSISIARFRTPQKNLRKRLPKC